MWDERCTTISAHTALNYTDTRGKKRKQVVDAVAATIILEDYLNYKKIYYHAVEDGLDCLKNLDDAYVANHGHFKLKAWFSRHNLIFIMNGWGKYCLDMEINDRSVVPTDCPRFVEVPRKPLEQALTSEQKKKMIHAFIEDADSLLKQMKVKV